MESRGLSCYQRGVRASSGRKEWIESCIGFFQPMEGGELESLMDWWTVGMEKYNSRYVGMTGNVRVRYGLFHRVTARRPEGQPEDPTYA